MQYVVVSVFDLAVGAYGRPAFVVSKGVAVRSFQDEVRRVAPENQMNTHPGDFCLQFLGFFDDSCGRFVQNDPEILCRGADCL